MRRALPATLLALAVADAWTTRHLLGRPGYEEGNLAAAWLMDRAGLTPVLVYSLVVFAALAAAIRRWPHPATITIGLIAAAAKTAVVANNLWLIVAR